MLPAAARVALRQEESMSSRERATYTQVDISVARIGAIYVYAEGRGPCRERVLLLGGGGTGSRTSGGVS